MDPFELAVDFMIDEIEQWEAWPEEERIGNIMGTYAYRGQWEYSVHLMERGWVNVEIKLGAVWEETARFKVTAVYKEAMKRMGGQMGLF